MKAKEKIKVTTMNEMIPQIGKKVVVNEKEIGIFLTDNGDLYAIWNICPHKEGPLSEGTVSGDYVYCPLHDQKIALKTGEVQQPDTGCVETYEVEVIDGDIYLCL